LATYCAETVFYNGLLKKDKGRDGSDKKKRQKT
jgi:hypothetical protein